MAAFDLPQSAEPVFVFTPDAIEGSTYDERLRANYSDLVERPNH